MKNALFLIFFFGITILALFAGGIPDRDRQSFGSLQLRVVNLTGNTIRFYFDNLHIPTSIRSQEEHITMKMVINNDYPSFIGIQFNNDENIIVYRFSYRHIHYNFLENGQYIVVIKNSSINFIEGSIDNEYDYFDEALYQNDHRVDWVRQSLGEQFIDFKIKNNSGARKFMYVYTVCLVRKGISLEDGMTETLTIDTRLFMLRGMGIQVLDGGGTVDNILLRHYFWRRLNSNTIEIIINTRGHEIVYH